jgi:lipid A 3-O-deacylase
MICGQGQSFCYAGGAKPELNWDYSTHWHFEDRYIDTVSLHMLEKISKKGNRSVYRGITITRPYGHIVDDNHRNKDSSAVGVGPTYMIRSKIYHFAKLEAAIDMSGGLIIYDKAFPAGGRAYNFMWRFGPRFIYNFNPNSSLSIGYVLMHVSNGLHSRVENPSYNARGVSLGWVMNY